jgi:photosystem II oxygen-evolving enhancer protein 2
LGGLLEPYIETQKGFKLYTPTGWNKFDADPGVYDVKFQDIIESETTVQVSTSPVATATSVTAIGDLRSVGEKFAKSRSAELVNALQREVEGSLLFAFEFKGELNHEVLALCINRGKLYRVVATTSNKKWSKRADLYKNIIASFVPKGF